MLKPQVTINNLAILCLSAVLIFTALFVVEKISPKSRKIASVRLKDFKINPNKKTICSITINSPQERDKFKKYLSPKAFNFVELTDFADKNEGAEDSSPSSPSIAYGNSQWFQSACESGLKCDVLVVSGHFGGTFFGASDLTLSLDDMESQVCKNGCRGILNNPREVFLMGCNTLAGKDNDRRSPEEYVRVLIEDGFSRQEAEMIAGFRYSPMGSSNGDRMLNIFRGVPNVYGFNSIAPSGKTAAPFMDRYLKDKGPAYSKWLDQIKDKSINNKSLIKNFSVTAIVQAAGATTQNDAQDLSCKLNADEGSFVHKLQWIRKALVAPDMLEKLPYIVRFLEKNYLGIHELNDTNYKIIEAIGLEWGFVQNIQKLLEGDALSYSLETQVKLIKLMMLLDISPTHWMPATDRIVESLLLNPTIEKKDIICSDFYANSYENILYRLRPPSLKVSAKYFEEGLKLSKNKPAKYSLFLQTFQCIQSWNPQLLPLVLDAAEAELPNVKKHESTNFDYLFAALKAFSLHDQKVLDRIYSWSNAESDIKADVRRLVVQRAGREAHYHSLLKKISLNPQLFEQNVNYLELSNMAQLTLLMEVAGSDKERVRMLTEWFSYHLASHTENFPTDVRDQIKIIEFLFAANDLNAIRALPLSDLQSRARAVYNEKLAGAEKLALREYLRGYNSGANKKDNETEISIWKTLDEAIKAEYFRGYVEGAKDKGSLDWEHNNLFHHMFQEMGLKPDVIARNPYVFDLLVQFRTPQITAQQTESLYAAYAKLMFAETEDEQGFVSYDYQFNSWGEDKLVVGLADTLESVELDQASLVAATKKILPTLLTQLDPEDDEYPKRLGMLLRPLVAKRIVTKEAVALYTEYAKSPNRYLKARASIGLMLLNLQDEKWKKQLAAKLTESNKKYGMNDVADVYGWGIRHLELESDPLLKKAFSAWADGYQECNKCLADEE